MLKSDPTANVAAALANDGVSRLDAVLSPATAAALRAFVLETKKAGEAAVTSGLPRTDYFADVLLRKNRCDVLLPLDAPVANALREALSPENGLAAALEATLGSGAVLYELAALISEPGAPRQVAHPDTPWHPASPLLTTFLALQNVLDTTGPTCFLPKTHSSQAHSEFFGAETVKDDFLRNASPTVALLKAGDAAVFDSRLVHFGTANRGEIGSERVLFYFTFRNPKIDDPGNPPSLRRNLANKFTLAGMRKALSGGRGAPAAFTAAPASNARNTMRGATKKKGFG
ncbi:hypothetical protein M885DRAFT_431349 [Pelagophyceae sp. CCMP2097]|nr:hypothetical protein M885DRAFT_431349 [Pelagophyceae sp. CCMP2097]